MRLMCAVAIVMGLGCGNDAAMPPDGMTPEPDAPRECAGERLVTPLDPVEPLFGEACVEPPFPQIGGCRPDNTLPGGFAGFCVAGICRPICSAYIDGADARQCCLRGGVEAFSDRGACTCVPIE